MNGVQNHQNIRSHVLLLSLVFTFVTICQCADAYNTTASTNESFLLNATERPTEALSVHLSEEIIDLKCAQRSLVGPDYNRIFQPLPSEGMNATATVQDDSEKSEPTMIRIIVDILRVMDVDEHEEVIVLLLTLKQFWRDGRLKEPPEYTTDCPKIKKLSNDPVRYLPEDASKSIWFPDVYLNRVEELHISKVLVNSDALRVDKYGNVSYTMFGKFKLSCEMNFRNFPLDVQYCPMYVESWRIRTTEQDLFWDLSA